MVADILFLLISEADLAKKDRSGRSDPGNGFCGCEGHTQKIV